MRTKKRSQQIHAANRARERFGINLSQHDQTEICRMIRDGEATFVRKDSNRVSVFDVTYQGNVIRAVYDKQRHSLATVLTVDFK